MSAAITGVFNILATPFDMDDQIDIPSLRKLVDFQIRCGAYGLTILGVLGEASKLTVDERKLVVATVMEANAGRVPVVVGTSHQTTATCIQLSNNAIAAGATGVMISPPRFDKVTDDKIVAFYEEVANAYSAPIVVQDFPPVNDVIMSPDVLATLANRIPNIRHLKLEDPPLMQKITAIRERTNLYEIFGGLGGMFFLEELKRGAAGTMTGFAFTEILVAVYKAFNAGQVKDAERIFDHYLPLIRFENQPVINLSIRKELLRRRGVIATARLRQPYVGIDYETREEIPWILRRVGIVDPTRPALQ
ncbi:MAG: dihydrodipicolinate synthase family protein [Anaerolineae bacterium]|nr:dihydrodipicolinate synthase family protein [Anaerolineae bacterium]